MNSYECDERRKLMKKIDECEFMVIDLGQFLDTHPDCWEAYNQLCKHRDEYKMYAAEYEKKFGPLIMYRTDFKDYWTWVELPWPWEKEAN